MSLVWVVREVKYSSDYITRPLTEAGLTRQLFAATRTDDVDKPYMQDLIRLARSEAAKLQQARPRGPADGPGDR